MQMSSCVASWNAVIYLIAIKLLVWEHAELYLASLLVCSSRDCAFSSAESVALVFDRVFSLCSLNLLLLVTLKTKYTLMFIGSLTLGSTSATSS